MGDLFAEAVGVDDFAMPGDDAILGRETTPAPEPAAEQPEPVEAAEPVAATTEPESAQAEPATTEPVVGEPDYAEKIAALEKRLADKDEMIGRQSAEVAEARRLIDEVAARQQQPPPVQITTDLIDENPAYATALAYEQGHNQALTIAFEQWKEIDPFAAATWRSDRLLEQRLAEERAATQQIVSQIQQQVAPAQEATERQQLAAAMSTAYTANPGLDGFLNDDARVLPLLEEFPELGDQLANGDASQKARAASALFQIDRGRTTDTLNVTKEEIARETAKQAQQAREDAFVASASTASNGVKPSFAEQLGAEWDAMEAPYRDGWNV